MNMEIPQITDKNPARENLPKTAAADIFLKTSHSKFFKITAVILAELILLIGAFSVGTKVGFRKAVFTYSWSQNYPNNFGGSKMMPPPPNGQFFNPHGMDGTILSADKNTLVIKDGDNNEKTVIISAQTAIRQNFQSLGPTDLKTGEEIVVIGEPNPQGQIEAKLIRVLEQK